MKVNHCNYYENKSIEDVFGAYLVEDAQFDGYYDIPYTNCPSNIKFPTKLVSNSKVNSIECDGYTYVHFYQKDYTFDGKYGVWYSLVQNEQFKRGFNLNKLSKAYAVICPDFSTYYDMPRIMQIWSVYKSRTFGYFMNRIGYISIPNVRWTDEKSYIYSFAGLRQNEIVAVSTLGCLRSNNDREFFYKGFVELINRVHPKFIIIYGSFSEKLKEILYKHQQEYEFFPSEIVRAMENKYGNES